MEKPATSVPPELGGYILAGGRSSRMGTDKALLQLAGKPLIAHAVEKLRRLCMDVRILSSNPALAGFAPLVPDLHPGCGPIGGMEAALAHSIFPWNLILPVDVPFLPTAFLDDWVRSTIADEQRGARIALFTVDSIPQSTLLLIHHEAANFLSQAIASGNFKLFPALEAAGREIAARHNLMTGRVFLNTIWNPTGSFRASPSSVVHSQPWQTITDAQHAAKALWFANLNTPEEFAQAEANTAALDT